MTLTIENLIELLKKDNKTNTKQTCHLSNDILLRACEKLDKNEIIDIEPSRSTHMVNRGSTFEVLLKKVLNKRFDLDIPAVKPSPKGQKDLDTSKLSKNLLDYLGLPTDEVEIKFSTSFAYASKIEKANPNLNVIVATQNGIFLGQAKDLNKNKQDKILPNQYQFKRLENLSKIMGY